MEYKIAILSDIHGNFEALKAVIIDAEIEQATDFWLLGDIFLSGSGRKSIINLLNNISISSWIKGNWDDSFLEVLDGEYTTQTNEEIYVAKLSQYLNEELPSSFIEKLRSLPLIDQKLVNGIKISLSHHLPNKNWGSDLVPENDTTSFDQLFINESIDVAVYAHTHRQLLRYGSNGQIIINPGSVGQPYYPRNKFVSDYRAQYAIITINDLGFFDVKFKKVDYDQAKEIENARVCRLPFFELYEKSLLSGNFQRKENDLNDIITEYHYKEDVENWFKLLKNHK